MKIQSFTTLPHADGRSGEVFLVHKTVLVSQEKGVTVTSQTIEANGDKDSDIKKTQQHIKTIKCLPTARPK